MTPVRAYAFTVQESAHGPYLLIDEVRHTIKVESMTGREYTRRRIAVFADHLAEFIATLQQVQRALKAKR
jgi:hypothetical protein